MAQGVRRRPGRPGRRRGRSGPSPTARRCTRCTPTSCGPSTSARRSATRSSCCATVAATAPVRCAATRTASLSTSAWPGFAAGEPGGTWHDTAPAGVPGPDDLPSSAAYLAGSAGRHHDRGRPRDYWSSGPQLRHAPRARPGLPRRSRAQRSRTRRCGCKPFDALRPVDGLTDAQRDLAALAYVCDYTILEPVLRVLGRAWAEEGLVTASLDHAMWFHRPGPPGWMDGWLLYAQEAVGRRGRTRARDRPLLHPRRPPRGHRRPGGHDPRAARRSPMNLSPLGPRRHLRPRPPAAGRPVADAGVHDARAGSTPSASTRPSSSSTCRSRRSEATGSRCARRTARSGPTASCSAAPTRWRRCWSRTSGWCRATGCCCARRTTRGRWRAWLGVLKAGGIVVTTIAALRARELTPIVEKDAAHDRPGRPPVRSTTSLAVRETVAPDLTVVAFGSDAADDLSPRADHKAGELRRRRHRRRRRRAVLPDLRAAPASRRSPRTSTATSSPSTTPSAATSCGCGPTTSWRAPHRSPSPSASGMLVVFPLRAGACALLDRGGDAGASSPTSSPSTASPCWRPRRRRTSRSSQSGTIESARGAARRGQRRRAHPGADVGAAARRARPGGHRRHRRAPSCCTSSSRRPATTSGPGATGKPVPGYRATILGPDGDELAAGRGGPARGDRAGRLPLPRRRAPGGRTS